MVKLPSGWARAGQGAIAVKPEIAASAKARLSVGWSAGRAGSAWRKESPGAVNDLHEGAAASFRMVSDIRPTAAVGLEHSASRLDPDRREARVVNARARHANG